MAQTSQTRAQITELSARQSAILRHAVNLAKNENIHRLAILRRRLNDAWASNVADVNVALQYWADHEKRRERYGR